MQVWLSKTILLVVGGAGKDAELKHVGEKNTALCSFSLAIGKGTDGQTQWAECAAWSKLSSTAAEIRKGDIVLAIGTIKSEVSKTNGKTYTTLNCDFVSNASIPNFGGIAQSAASGGVPVTDKDNSDFVEVGSDDDSLPF
jgi:single-stranded DNA-binding protein